MKTRHSGHFPSTAPVADMCSSIDFTRNPYRTKSFFLCEALWGRLRLGLLADRYCPAFSAQNVRQWPLNLSRCASRFLWRVCPCSVGGAAAATPPWNKELKAERVPRHSLWPQGGSRGEPAPSRGRRRESEGADGKPFPGPALPPEGPLRSPVRGGKPAALRSPSPPPTPCEVARDGPRKLAAARRKAPCAPVRSVKRSRGLSRVFIASLLYCYCKTPYNFSLPLWLGWFFFLFFLPF